ncbi:MAG: radical SAM family heme chaperone HemW [Gammaproteobacteria bacterium]|nr:radical SAM family heme chaperone HemW [Gammaproteobacteria bacterium]MCH9743928.1 radical SAM family heme chaperone HemW [Gammaproteobacteria bacterium]
MNIPISLYIHTPWCIKKCPYCDFNSHAVSGKIPESDYQQHLQNDFSLQCHFLQQRPLHSIFIGGGTPSLLEADIYETLFKAIKRQCHFSNDIEITLEANPGTVEQQRFQAYRDVGINRLSIGIQSFNDKHLKALGRIHDSKQALMAIEIAKEACFDNFNLDIMFGLPEQTLDQALLDLEMAIRQEPTHISWYQLTLEPNTLFDRFPPKLPDDETLWEMQQKGQQLLAENGYQQYEVSAYAKDKKQCQHNLNYWLFGDYIGIGAGAHGKVTDNASQKIIRRQNFKNPRDYMNEEKNYLSSQLNVDQPLFEYLLNALRLNQPIPVDHIIARTFLDKDYILEKLQKPLEDGLIVLSDNIISKTEYGTRFLNDLTSHFMS